MTPGHILVPLLAVAAVLPFVPPAAGLVTGVAVALAFGNPWLPGTRKLAPFLLGIAVMGSGRPRTSASWDALASGESGTRPWASP